MLHGCIAWQGQSLRTNLGCFGIAGDVQIDECQDDVSALQVELSHEGHLEAVQEGLLHAVHRQGSSAVLQSTTEGPQAVAGLLIRPVLQSP